MAQNTCSFTVFFDFTSNAILVNVELLHPTSNWLGRTLERRRTHYSSRKISGYRTPQTSLLFLGVRKKLGTSSAWRFFGMIFWKLDGWMFSLAVRKNQRLQREGDLFFLPCLCFLPSGKASRIRIEERGATSRRFFFGSMLLGRPGRGVGLGWGAKGEG